MTQTTKEVFEKYQVRKSKKQRTAFIEYVKTVAQNLGYETKIEKGTFGARNIVVGNADKAKVLYTAHYDTCAKMFFPNFITPKNFLIYALYQLLIVAGFFVVSGIVGILATAIMMNLGINDMTATDAGIDIAFLVYFVMLFLLILGPANKHTANDNTSGVTTLLDIMASLPDNQRDKVAFVFFDLEEAGLFGSSSFAKNHKDIRNNTLVINFDCVSDGKTILFALKKTTKKYKDLLLHAFKSTDTITVDVAEKGVFYPSDNANFKGGIGVAALKTSMLTKTLYMNRIHTSRDTVYDEENITYLVNGAIKLAEII
ncbi:MAG: M28 family peptidase [Ruminococcus sp.]|nr:M28 family peptidase [Ruminococcus sp.]